MGRVVALSTMISMPLLNTNSHAAGRYKGGLDSTLEENAGSCTFKIVHPAHILCFLRAALCSVVGADDSPTVEY